VAELVIKGAICGRSVAQLRDESGVLVLHMVRTSGETIFDPAGPCCFEQGDRVTVQATLKAYQGLREKLIAA
jgi:Trk K+ transport system NAD-binding subunit